MNNKVLCHYRVAEGNEEAFEELLLQHWSILHELELVTDDPPLHFKGKEQDNGMPIYFEIFDWLDDGMKKAHEHPKVLAIWGPMGKLCEERNGKPSMEFPHVSTLNA